MGRRGAEKYNERRTTPSECRVCPPGEKLKCMIHGIVACRGRGCSFGRFSFGEAHDRAMEHGRHLAVWQRCLLRTSSNAHRRNSAIEPRISPIDKHLFFCEGIVNIGRREGGGNWLIPSPTCTNVQGVKVKQKERFLRVFPQTVHLTLHEYGSSFSWSMKRAFEGIRAFRYIEIAQIANAPLLFCFLVDFLMKAIPA